MNDRQKALEQKQRLEQLVIHLKMNLVDLADLSGLNKNTLYHVGSGEKSEITERSVARICYHLEGMRLWGRWGGLGGASLFGGGKDFSSAPP